VKRYTAGREQRVSTRDERDLSTRQTHGCGTTSGCSSRRTSLAAQKCPCTRWWRSFVTICGPISQEVHWSM
jgi:hypothetical protein